MVKDILRRVTLRPYLKGKGPSFTLTTWESDKYDPRGMGRYKIAYHLTMCENRRTTTLFSGDDFAASPMHCIDSDEATGTLLMFLTLRPGDTDADYFAGYTPAQLAFAEDHAEALQLEVMSRFGEDL